MSKLMFGADRPVIALFHRHDPGADFTGEAQVPLDNNTNALLVEAPGHGFELVDVVAGDEPQVVALGSEAVVTGVGDVGRRRGGRLFGRVKQVERVVVHRAGWEVGRAALAGPAGTG